ncbi:MAG: von Willebrand factor type domain [Fibrobacteres bacterium]|nr:von Willebrand factor type domain [Fibrobacterota bacterium]
MSSLASNRFFGARTTAFGTSLLVLSLTAHSAFAAKAAKRCDWHGPLSGGEKQYAKCVDFAALNGKTMDLPKNVTRIAADGLSFCVPPTPTTGAGDADIVFIYDNSGSMTADAAYGDPATGDTSFYYLQYGNGAPDACSQNPKGADLNYYTREGTTRSVLLLTANANCNRQIAGDPYNARGAVIKVGIDFLAKNSPTSTAGTISFTDQLKYQQQNLPVNNAGNVNTIKNSIQLDTSGSTHYGPPLELANQWLNNPAIIKTKKQAIIFISDGAPQDNYAAILNAGLPPVYSIYLSKSTSPDTAKLKEISDKTGGTFTRVNPNDPKAFEAVMTSIITTITRNTLPKGTTVTNKSLSPPQVSKSTTVTGNPDGSVGMQLDSIIALKEGPNQIEINLVREDNTTITYAFTMNVAGSEISSSAGNYSCWDMPTLAAIDKKTGLVAEIYRPDNNTYQLKLTRSPSDLRDVNVAGGSANNDKENIPLSNLNMNLGFPTQTGDFTYNPAKSSPTLNNGVLEVDNHGDLTFTWSHPRDARETVTYILPGRIVPILSGDPTLKIREPFTKGVTFDPLKITNPVLITDSKNKCIVNCTGTEDFHTGGGVPTWDLTIKSPIRYSIKIFDNLGQFVSLSDGQMDAAAWTAISKSGDSATIQLKILPVSSDGQQLGTGAYLMMATITALGDEVKKGSNGESIIVRNAKRDYLRRFGYVRN